MITSRALVALVAGFGFAQMGCVAEQYDDERVNSVSQAVGEGDDDPTGTGGTNGLKPEYAMPNMLTLWNAMSLGVNNPNNTAIGQLANTMAGDKTLEYAIRAALPTGGTTFGPNQDWGGGILSTTTGWANTGISTGARLDVMTAMLAHLNPYGVSVPIRLMGQSVNSTLGDEDTGAYNLSEALWAVTRNRDGSLHYHVWPFEIVLAFCDNPAIVLSSRTCGKMTENGIVNTECTLNVHENVQNDCTQNATTKSWTCLGRPAIKTRIRQIDFLLLYPQCDPIPEPG
jgi:hypothetical protein